MKSSLTPDDPDNPDEYLISRRGLEIFAQVWHGDRSVYEGYRCA
jgi:hypothetical protein